MLLRIAACSTEGSGAEVTGVVGAAAGFSCCGFAPRRIERVIAAAASGATDACITS
jgi:hypothetical protein